MTGRLTYVLKTMRYGLRMQFVASLLLVILFGFSVGNSTVFAKDESSVTLQADSTKISVGVSTNITITFTNADKPEVNGITGIENFDVLSTSQASSTQIMNGTTTKQKQIIYTIVPKQEGTYELTGDVTINGQKSQTNTVTIQVEKVSTETVDGASDLYVKTVISKDAAYVGEKVVLTYELYSRYNIEQYGFLDSISFDNSLIEEVPQDNLNANYVTINGNKYVKYEAKKYIITPIKAGEINIPSYQFQANITSGGFFSQSKPMYIQSEAKKISVQSVPQDGQPVGYKGLVGAFQIESSYDKTDVTYGNPITLHVKIVGNGNLDSMTQVLDENAYPDFTIYETDQPIQTDYTNNEILMTKEAEIILVPKNTGTLNFQPKTISYFDTVSGTYKEIAIAPATIQVSGEKPTNTPQSSADAGGTQKILVTQTAYGSSTDLSPFFIIRKKHVYIGGLLLFILGIILCCALLYRSHDRRNLSQKKGKVVQNEFKRTKDLNEQYEIVCAVLKEKYGISLRTSTRTERDSRLKGISDLESLQEIVDYFEYGRYQNKIEPAVISQKMISLIKQIYR